MSARGLAWLAATMSAFVFDYCARQKIGGMNLNYFLLKQLPMPLPRETEEGALSFDAFFLPRVLELTFTAWDVESFGRDLGWGGPPFQWNEERRFVLRCELDAALFHIYLPAERSGDWRLSEAETAEDLARLKQSFPTPRDAVDYIMESFPIVRRRDEERYGGVYRTKCVIIEIYDFLQESIRTGQAYRTRLDPPPASPLCCYPPRGSREA
jgi:hypothetical protein